MRTSEVRRRVVLASIVAGLLLVGCGRPLQDPGAAPASTDGGIIASVAPDASAGAIDQLPGAAAPSTAAPEASQLPPGQPEASALPVEGAVEAAPSAAAEVAPEASAPPVEAAPAPTVDPAFAGVQLPPASERWRYMQMEREVFDPIRTYGTSGPEILWWYDPVFGQAVALGEINGEFPAQAGFRLRGQEAGALEVPYQINASFGLRLPDAITERMHQAGAGEWVETFIYAKSDIQPR